MMTNALALQFSKRHGDRDTIHAQLTFRKTAVVLFAY